MNKPLLRPGVMIPAAIVLAAVAAPLLTENRYLHHLMIMACIWGIAATALNLVMGYAGQVNLAHGAFFGIGAYTSGLLMLKLGLGFWMALPLACLTAGLFGLLIGLPSLRTKGAYFAIGTLCFNVIVTVIIDRWESLTEGQRGLLGIPAPSAIPLPFGATIRFDNSMVATYYLFLIMLLLTLFITRRIIVSLTGKNFRAVKGNEELAAAIGINPFRTKLVAFVTSTFFAGLAGGLYASYIGFLSPEISDFHVTFEVLIQVMFGGVGTMAGPIIGATILPVISETLHALAAYRMVAYGVMLIAVIIFLPTGIMGGLKLLWAKRSPAK